jgi:hypothetical protein
VYLCLGSGASSAPDLTFYSPGVALRFDRPVLPQLRGSDHYPVNFHMTAPSPTVLSPPKWIIRRAGWAGFSRSLTFEDQDFPIVCLLTVPSPHPKQT